MLRMPQNVRFGLYLLLISLVSLGLFALTTGSHTKLLESWKAENQKSVDNNLGQEREVFQLARKAVSEYVNRAEEYLDSQLQDVEDAHSSSRAQLRAHRRDVDYLLKVFEKKLRSAEVHACPGAHAEIEMQREKTTAERRKNKDLEDSVARLEARLNSLRHDSIAKVDMDACLYPPAEGEPGECSDEIKQKLVDWSVSYRKSNKKSLHFGVWMDWYSELRKKDEPARDQLFKSLETLPACNVSTPDLFPNLEIRNSSVISPEKVIILSGTDSSNEHTRQSLENRETYCNKWGFRHVFMNFTRWRSAKDSVEHPVWFKIPAIQEAFARFPEAEYVWWLDSDAIIMNMNIDLREHFLDPRALRERIHYGRPIGAIDSNFWQGSTYWNRDEFDVNNVSFIVSHDWLTLNLGSIVLRRSRETDEFLQFWGDPTMITDCDGDPTFLRREQDAFINMFQNSLSVRQRTAVVPQRLMNSYVDKGLFGEPGAAYQHGDFVIHLAGRRGGDFDYNWQEYLSEVQTLPDDESTKEETSNEEGSE